MTRKSPFHLGLRREVLILLPLATLLLVLLITFVLFSFRNGLDLLIDQRRDEALALARSVASDLAVGPLPTADELRRAAPSAQRIALVTEQGEPVVAFGDFEGIDLLGPQSTKGPNEDATAGPIEPTPGSVSAVTRLKRESSDLLIRLDLPAPELARQTRALRTLTVVVLTLSFLVSLLVFFFLRYLLRPYDKLLHTAREAQIEPKPEDSDEIQFLVSTFQRAVALMDEPVQREVEDDIAVLQRALTPSLESGVLLLDDQGSILALNQLGASLLGLDEPTLPADLEDTLERHTELLPHLLRAVSEKKGAKRLEASVWVDNTSRTLGLTIHTLRRNDGSVRGYLVLFTDLTELRQRAEEERLSESLTQLGQLAAGIAHELRNGLATLRGYLTLIERHPGEESITDYLMEIRRESDHLERVLRDFLVFARPESLQVGDIDLWKLVERVAADPALAAARIEVVNKAPNRPRVRGDEQLLDQVIRNLLRNAVEASDTPSTDKHADVWVTLQQSGEDLDLTIEDCGPGLPRDLEDRLFQPFVSSKSGGVGLGLSIAQGIASLHGLRIQLENREGAGARATLHFPSVTFVT